MPENTSQEISLDWSSAEVHDGALEVALDGRPEKDWKQAFKRTTRLLNRGTWDEVSLKKGRISVGSIVPGDEDRVRHFLESAVLEANSAVQTTDPGDAEPGEDTETSKQEDEHEDPQDREMTKRLRSFAEPSGGD